MTDNTKVTAHYADVFKAWPTALIGPKPTAEMLMNVHRLGLRPGKQALANAMACRDKGVTAGQIVIACGAPQLNKMRDLITDALVKRVAVPKTPEGHTVYKLELTAKGKARIERSAKAEAKADEAGKVAEAKAEKRAPGDKAAAAQKAKARVTSRVKSMVGPIAAPMVDATSEAASVTVTAPAAPDAPQAQA